MNSQLNLLALPDETLLMILNELPMVDVLYSLADVNRRLNRLAHDSLYIRHLDLTGLATIHSRWNPLFPTDQYVASRMCEKILPRIHDQVHQLTVEPYAMNAILATVNYPQLYSLSLRDFHDEVLHHCLTGMIVDLFCIALKRISSHFFLVYHWRWFDSTWSSSQSNHASPSCLDERRIQHGNCYKHVHIDLVVMWTIDWIGIHWCLSRATLADVSCIPHGKEFSLLNVDQIKNQRRYYLWLSSSFRWTSGFSVKINYQRRWYLCCPDEYFPGGKFETTIFSMVVLFLFSRETSRDWNLSHSPHFVWPTSTTLWLFHCFVEWSISKNWSCIWRYIDRMIVTSMVFNCLMTSWFICHNYRNLHLTFKHGSQAARVTCRFWRMKLFNVVSVEEIIKKCFHLCIPMQIPTVAIARYTHFHMTSNIFLISAIPFPVVCSGKCDFWRCGTNILSKMHYSGSSLTTCLFSDTWKYPMCNPGNQNIIKHDVFYAKNTKKMAFRMMERTKTLMYFDFINEKGTFHQYHSMILIFY